MIEILKLTELDEGLFSQYKAGIQNAFPEVILRSPVIAKYWDRVEEYFPDYQLFMVENHSILGFVNSIPFYWDKPLTELPEEGWDWMLKKGVSDYESGLAVNSLGGLQIIVTQDNQGKGYSKILIDEARKAVVNKALNNLIIPIRPTFKNRFPHMSMADYIDLKVDNKIYDPWIRTHLKSGAKIISICSKAMLVDGDLNFWEELANKKIEESGSYIIEGALSPVSIDVENNYGQYWEDNIWIAYPSLISKK